MIIFKYFFFNYNKILNNYNCLINIKILYHLKFFKFFSLSIIINIILKMIIFLKFK